MFDVHCSSLRGIRLIGVVLALAVAQGVPAEAGDNPSAAEILARADAARGGGLPGVRWQARVITVENGRERVQEMVVEARDRDSLVTFEAPARVRGQRLLMRGRNLWFLRPDVRRPVPISPRQRLLGDAATSDVAATNYAADYEAREMTIQPCGEESCYVLELHAISEDVTYDHIRYWVSVVRETGVKAEFFTVSGRRFRTAELEYDNRVIHEGREYPFVSRMLIREEVSEGHTILEYRDVQASEIPDRRFDPQYLVR